MRFSRPIGRKRQTERELAPLADPTGDLDGCLERSGKPFRNGKTEPQSRGTAPPRRGGTIEGLEEEVHLLLGDADTAVLDREQGRRSVSRETDP